MGGPHTLYFAVKDRAHMHTIAYFHIETKVHCSVGNPNGVRRGGFGILGATDDSSNAKICKADDLELVLKRNADSPVCPIATIERMLPQPT